MGADIKPILKIVDKSVDKTIQAILNKIEKTPEEYRQIQIKGRIASRKAGKKVAKHWNLNPIDDVDLKIKNLLTERIIQEVKGRKLKHRQVAIVVRTSRPSITRILNRNLKEASLEFLLRILCALGIETKVSFKS